MRELLTDLFSCFFDEKYTISSFAATLGGIFVSFIGGWDKLMVTYVTLMTIDYITGVIGAIYQKKLSSAIGFRGIIKKVLSVLIVGLAVSLQSIIPVDIPLREITIVFFIANEGISVLENAAGIIPLPKKLKEILLQLEEKSESISIGSIKSKLIKSKDKGTTQISEAAEDQSDEDGTEDNDALQADPLSVGDDKDSDNQESA